MISLVDSNRFSYSFLLLFLYTLTGIWQVHSAAIPLSHAHEARASSCFPFGATISGNKAPSVSRDQWWCPASQQYGFLGFSYPLEDSDCQSSSNSFDKINKDFQRMKKDFGATMVRVYAPECRDKSVWKNLLKAGVANNMAIIPQVWWGFEDQNLYKKTQDAIISVIQENPLAPFVFHSIAYGSEPIGDSVDGGPSNFVEDMKAFKAKVSKFNIPVTLSEDWDRPGSMVTKNGQTFNGLGPVGKQLSPVIDMVHAHIMPYYQNGRTEDFFPYFESYITSLKKILPGKPILISETQWASQQGGSHDRGNGNKEETLENFKQYWNTIAGQCSFFKEQQVGWFMHTYDDTFELGFGLLDNSGKPKIPGFRPKKC